MRTWEIVDNEPVLDSEGNISIIEGLPSLAENLDQRLKLFKNKYYMNLQAGVPYIEDILKKPIDPGFAASILNDEILKEGEVTKLGEVNADLERNTRIFNYSAVVDNIFNESITIEFP